MAIRWQRYSALAGIVAVLLWIVGTTAVNTSPPGRAAPEQILASYQQHDRRIAVGGVLFLLGTLFFLWFLGSLRVRLWRGERADGMLTSLSFGSGIALTVFGLLLPLPDTAAAVSAGELTPATADTFSKMGNLFFLGAEFTAAAFLVSVATHALLTKSLPRWLAFAGFALAAVLVIPPVAWAGLLGGLPAWTVAASLALFSQKSFGTTRHTQPPAQESKDQTVERHTA